MRYKKKPIEIEAIRWTGSIDQEDPQWIVDSIKRGTVRIHYPYIDIVTLEGVMRASNGDYIIKGVQGEIYPCKPDIFDMTYEEVRDEE